MKAHMFFPWALDGLEVRKVHAVTRIVCGGFAVLALPFAPLLLWQTTGAAEFTASAFLAWLAVGSAHVAIANRVPAYFVASFLAPLLGLVVLFRHVVLHLALVAGALLYLQPDGTRLGLSLGAWLAAAVLRQGGLRYPPASVSHRILVAVPGFALFAQVILWESVGVATDLVTSFSIQLLLYTFVTRDASAPRSPEKSGHPVSPPSAGPVSEP